MITLSESGIDRHIERTIKYVDGSDLGLKCACIAASPVIGAYDGTTQQIAANTRRSVSTVENWAHAHWAYREYRSNGNRKMARLLWRELPATHWWKAWDIHQAGYNALYYLTSAYQYGWSSKGMMAEFDKERTAGHAPLQVQRAKIALYGLANELLKYRLTEAEQQACLFVIDTFKESE